MSTVDYRDIPIPEEFVEGVPHDDGSPRVDGDDSGYRSVKVDDNFDPIVHLNERIKRYIVYAEGAKEKICLYYPGGIGAPNLPLVREPVNTFLLWVDELLKPYNRRVLVLDVLRRIEDQRKLWVYLFKQLLGDRDLGELSLTEFLQLGMAADDVGSYAPVARDGWFNLQLGTIKASMRCQLGEAAQRLGITDEEAAEMFLTFRRNLDGEPDLSLDITSTTAHGTGGAIDMIMIDTTTGEPTNLGVPFDYISPQGLPIAALRYFEGDNLEEYRTALDADPLLLQFQQQFYPQLTCGADFTWEMYLAIRIERRLWYWAVRAARGTFYVGECWHANAGNPVDHKYPGAGSGCQSILLNIRDEQGDIIAVWGMEFAQAEATRIFEENRLKAGIQRQIDAAEALDNKCAVLAEHMGADSDPTRAMRDAVLGEHRSIS